MEKIKRIYIRNAVAELIGKERQLSLFPYSNYYRLFCKNTKMCYDDSNCDHCRHSDIIRNDFDPFLQPQRY